MDQVVRRFWKSPPQQASKWISAAWRGEACRWWWVKGVAYILLSVKFFVALGLGV